MLEKLKMTEFQPTPQTPEQVDEGLRNAFRQAIKDGVMDATPYLKQMTFKSDIEKTKAEIKVLEKKLALLEEIEKQPRMNLEQEGEYAVVSYHDKVYYRLENKTTFSWYIKKDVSEYNIHYRSPNLVMVEDAETERLLEGLYYNYIQVKKEAVKQGVVSSATKPQDLTELIFDWWEDVFTTNSDWDMETSIDDLVTRIDEWLPKEQSAAGSQNVYVECTVEGFNDCLNKIKRKLR
jgi:hypothetical protein